MTAIHVRCRLCVCGYQKDPHRSFDPRATQSSGNVPHLRPPGRYGSYGGVRRGVRGHGMTPSIPSTIYREVHSTWEVFLSGFRLSLDPTNFFPSLTHTQTANLRFHHHHHHHHRKGRVSNHHFKLQEISTTRRRIFLIILFAWSRLESSQG